jgi:hypothetical protein
MLPDNPRFIGLAAKLCYCFKKAGALFDPPLEYLEIPFENTVLPGYFRKGGAGGRPRQTLVMIGGGRPLPRTVGSTSVPGPASGVIIS